VSSEQVGVGDIPRELPAFWPRAGLLADLDRTGDATPVVHLLTGPSGTGKTQLAAAYAHAKLAAGWRLVAWVNAGTSGTLLAGLAAAADAMGLSAGGREQDTPDPGHAVRCWLEADGDRCLLVFDGAEDLVALKPFVPARGAARVLITTTGRAGASAGTSIGVDVMAPAEAAAFLAGRTGLADAEGATTVAAELGHLPLALAQAAAVIAALHLEYPAYLEGLRATAAAGEPVQKGQDEAPPLYPPGAVRAASLALNTVWTADETGVRTRVIALVAVLSAAGVRRELLHVAGQAGMLTSGGRPVAAAAVDDVVAELADRSLLNPTMDGQVVVMHRLVAETTRSWLAGQGQLAAAGRAAAAVLEAWARVLDLSRDRPAVRELSEQVTALLGRAAGSAAKSREGLARALLLPRFLALYYLIELGDSAPQAVAVGEPLTADLERWLGPSHPDTLNAQNSLAAAYLASGRPAEAIPLFERTLVGRERTLGPDHPDSLNSQNNLAAAYQDAGRVAEAILLFRLTLAARARRLGADHPDTLNSYGNLAAAYRAAGRVSEAIPLLEQTLAGRERVLGASHPDTQAARSNLDQANRDASRPPEELLAAAQLSAAPPAVEQPPADLPQVIAQSLPAELEAEPFIAVPAEVTAEELAAEEPVADEPTVEVPAAAEPVAEEPVAEEPVAEDPAVGDPAVEEPTVDEPTVDEPTVEESVAAEPVAEEPVREEPVREEPVLEEPVAEEAVPREPVAEEPEEREEPEAAVAERPVPDEPAAGEPEGDAARPPAPPPDPEPAVAPAGPPAGAGRPAAGRPVRRAAPVLRVAAVILIALVAGAAAFTVSRLHVGHHSPSRRGTGHARPASAAQLAADWVAQQVSRNVTVACDPLMCAALEARGLPTAKLLVLRADAANPLGAGVVVVTPAVRSQFGRRLDSEYAPLVIAGFGSGPGQVDVQVVAPDGAAAYLAALRQDLTARKSAGTQLLANKQIGATARARAQLEAGSVDSRLLIVLPTLAATHPIQVLAFGDSGPGAGPDTPLCVAELSGSGRAAGMADAAYQRWLTSFIGAQLNHFTGSVSVIRVDGQPVVRLEFARPSPLGLLTG
jgi:tetratricopeptide (TPR) repeat protein